jgi:predicted nuclease with TOPRIM domain
MRRFATLQELKLEHGRGIVNEDGEWCICEMAYEECPKAILLAEIDRIQADLQTTLEELEVMGASHDHLDDLAEERRLEIEELHKVIERLESKIELAQEQADYGARHGQEAQDTLDVVLSALEGGR